MRGGFLHNLLVCRIAECFTGTEAVLHREYPTCPGRNAGFVDLFVHWGPWRIAIEAELSADRVGNDIAKAISLDADLLLIVTPDSRIARAAEAQVARFLRSPEATAQHESLAIWCLPLGVAIQRLARKSHLKTALIVHRAFGPKHESLPELDRIGNAIIDIEKESR